MVGGTRHQEKKILPPSQESHSPSKRDGRRRGENSSKKMRQGRRRSIHFGTMVLSNQKGERGDSFLILGKAQTMEEKEKKRLIN